MIDVENLKKNYGAKEALKGITFEVGEGEIFGFLGPNGAGKTTTVKILTGQLLPSYGEARIMDRDVTREQKYIQPYMGIVPEQANLYERLTVGQNLELFARLYNCSLSNVGTYLEQVNLIQERNTPVKKLSKGMKQRVLLARALLHSPRVLFLDEPTSGLDPASADNIHKMLLDLNREGMTILLTSHNMEEVDKLCRRVAFLDQGAIVAAGTPNELKLKHANRRMKVLIDINGQMESREMDMEGQESADRVEEWIRKGQLRSIHSCEPTLAEIFVKVTGRDFA